MSQTQSPSRKRPYRLQRVCRVWQFPRSTVHEHRRRAALRPEERLERKKRGPQGPCTDDELAEKIRELLKASPFHGEGYRKMWAQLRAQDIRTSKERVRRVMREHGLQVPQRAGQPRGPQAHDGTITTERPDQMWGTDLTTGEGTATVFVAVDHCSSECIGIHAAATGDRFEALEPIHQGVREHFGGGDKGIAGGLQLRHDHGSAYMSDHFQKQIDFLGIESSPSFVRAPEGNGCSERFIRTLKENLLWVRYFATVEELRLALLEFQERSLEGYDLVALFLDGKSFADEELIIALGVTLDGHKIPLGFVEAATENERVCRRFLADLVDRGPQYEAGLLVLIDGAKGLYKAVMSVLKGHACVQRCQCHKRKNVVSYLPKSEQARVRRKIEAAYNKPTYEEAKATLKALKPGLKLMNQSALKSLEEGLEETLTLHRLGLMPMLKDSFRTTNCIENVNSLLGQLTRNVRHWTNSSQRHRWAATALLDIEDRLRRVKGYHHLSTLRQALQTKLGIKQLAMTG